MRGWKHSTGIEMHSLLLVDDEPDMLFVWRYILSNAGYHVRTGLNGVAALELIDAQRPDLVITDWMMPVMSGEELCRALRAHPTYSTIPVLVHSAISIRPGDVDRSWNEWLVKPAGRQAFLATVARLCGKT